ncbi:hypothetical protein B0H34DRAFT_728930 [Crassisporium funariophilum]|nr:hypothetical protein B0H34DRAFT_728930 [Crassisporium funariophilum]
MDIKMDLRELNPAHLNLPIIDVNLCVMMDAQGVCDERSDLSAPRPYRKRHAKDPAPANHYALWFGFGDMFNVAIDVTQGEVIENPYLTEDPETRGSIATVRVASKTIPAKEDMGCVLREFNVAPGTTVNRLVQLIMHKGLHFYKFTPVYKQHAGCRFWILELAKAIEKEAFVGKGFAEDVKLFLDVYYTRTPRKSSNGRWVPGDSWGPRKGIECAKMVAGSFYKC